MDTKMLLAAISQDLYRVAIGYHNGSNKMAQRFSQEVLKRSDQIDKNLVKDHIRKVLDKLPHVLAQDNKTVVADQALTYSIILQNAALSRGE